MLKDAKQRGLLGDMGRTCGCGPKPRNFICECDKIAQDLIGVSLNEHVSTPSSSSSERVESIPSASCSEDNVTDIGPRKSQSGISLDCNQLASAILENISRNREDSVYENDFSELYYYHDKDYRKWLKRLTLFCWFINKPSGPKINLHDLNFVNPRMERLFKKRNCQMRKFMKQIIDLKQNLQKENLHSVDLSKQGIKKHDDISPSNIYICNQTGFSIPYVSLDSQLMTLREKFSKKRKKIRTASQYLGCFFLKSKKFRKSTERNKKSKNIEYTCVMGNEKETFSALRLYSSKIQNDTFFKLINDIYQNKAIEWSLQDIYLLEKFKLRYVNKSLISGSVMNNEKSLVDENIQHNVKQNIFNERELDEILKSNRETLTTMKTSEINQHACEPLVLPKEEKCGFSRWIDLINRICCVPDEALYPCNFIGNAMPFKEDDEENRKESLPQVEVVPSGPTRLVTIFNEDDSLGTEDKDNYSDFIGKTNFDENQTKLVENDLEYDKELESDGKYRPNFDSRVEFYVGKMNKHPRKYRPSGEFSETYFQRKKMNESFEFVEEFSEKLDAGSKRYANERALLKRHLKSKNCEDSMSSSSSTDEVSETSSYCFEEESISLPESNESIPDILNDLDDKRLEKSLLTKDHLDSGKEWCECTTSSLHLERRYEATSESSLSSEAISYLLKQGATNEIEDKSELISESGDLSSSSNDSSKPKKVSEFDLYSNTKEKKRILPNSPGLPDGHLPHFFQTDHDNNPDYALYENETDFPKTEYLRDRLLKGYSVPSISYNFRIEGTKDCLHIETISRNFITKRGGLTIDGINSEANIESKHLEEEIYFSESKILETLFFPFALRVCRVTLTCPLSLMIMSFFKDLTLLDVDLLFLAIRSTPGMMIQPKDDDIINMNNVFKEFLDRNKSLLTSRQCLNLKASNYFMTNILDRLEASLDANYKGTLWPFLIKNNFPPSSPICEGVNNYDFLSDCVKQILFYSHAYITPNFVTTMVYETNKTLRDLDPECGHKESEDGEELSDDIEWFESFNRTLESLEKSNPIKNSGSKIFWMSEILANSSGVPNFINEEIKTFFTFAEVPLISISLIDKYWSAWEELFHFGNFDMKNLKEASVYQTESEDESSCDLIDNESESSTDSSASSCTDENKLYQDCSNFDDFSLPKVYTLPKFKYPSVLFPEVNEGLEKGNVILNDRSKSVTESSKLSRADCAKAKRWSKEDIDTFENEMICDIEFELDCDFDRIRKFMMHHSISPEDKAKFFLNVKEYNELEGYVFTNLLFPCCIFNNPRDWYAFAKPSDKPITGPNSKTYKNVYQLKPESKMLTNECSSLPLKFYPLNKYASVKSLKMVLKDLHEEYLKMFIAEMVAADKAEARKLEKAALQERRGDDDKARRIGRDSIRSSSDILHLINKEVEAQPQTRRSKRELQALGVGKYSKGNEASELITFKKHKCKSSSGSSSSSSSFDENTLEADLSKPSSVLSFENPVSCSSEPTNVSQSSTEESICSECEMQSIKEDVSSLATFHTCGPLLSNNFEKQCTSHDYSEPTKPVSMEPEKDVLHFYIRDCKFSVRSAFGKIYEESLLPILVKYMDASNSRQEAMEHLIPGWIRKRHILKDGLQLNFPFIDRLQDYYHVSADDLLRPEHDLRPYNEVYGAGHRHWLSLDLFFDPCLSDTRADPRMGADLLEDRFDGEGSEFCLPAVAWLPIPAPPDSVRDVLGKIERVECQWQRVMVYDYLENESAYHVLPVSLEYGPQLVTRTYLVFLFENNDLAADRIYKAVTDRAIAENQLRSFMILNFSEPFLANEESLLLSESLLPDCEVEISMPLKLKKKNKIIYPGLVKSDIKLKSSSSDTRTLDYRRPGKNKRIIHKAMVDLFKEKRLINSMKHSSKMNLLRKQKKLFGQDFIRAKNIHMVRSLLREGDKVRAPLDQSKKKKRKLKRPPPEKFYKLQRLIKSGNRKWKLKNYAELIADQKIKLKSSAFSGKPSTSYPLQINSKTKQRKCEDVKSTPKMFQNRKDYYVPTPLLDSTHVTTARRGLKKKKPSVSDIEQQKLVEKKGVIQAFTDASSPKYSKMPSQEGSYASSKPSFHLKYKYTDQEDMPDDVYGVEEMAGSDSMKKDLWKRCSMPDRSSWWASKAFRLHRLKRREVQKILLSKSSSSLSDEVKFFNPLDTPRMEIIFSKFKTNSELKKLNWSKTLDPKSNAKEMAIVEDEMRSVESEILIKQSASKKGTITSLRKKQSQEKQLREKHSHKVSEVSMTGEDKVYKTYEKHYFLRSKNKNLRDINYDITMKIKRLIKKGSVESLTTEEIVKGSEVTARVKPCRDVPSIPSYRKPVYDFFNPPLTFSNESSNETSLSVRYRKGMDEVKGMMESFVFIEPSNSVTRKNDSGSSSRSYEILAHDGFKSGNKIPGADADNLTLNKKILREPESNIKTSSPSKISSVRSTPVESPGKPCASVNRKSFLPKTYIPSKFSERKPQTISSCTKEKSSRHHNFSRTRKNTGTTSSSSKIKFDGPKLTKKPQNSSKLSTFNQIKDNGNSNKKSDGSISKISSSRISQRSNSSDDLDSPPSSEACSKEYSSSHLSKITLNPEHLFKNKYHAPDVLPYVVETLKEIRKSILREFPSQYYKIPSPLERLDLLWDLVDELSTKGCEYGAKEQLIFDFLRGYVSIFDKSCYTPSIVAKFIGDFKKTAYASYNAREHTLDKVRKEASRVEGLALLHYITLNTRMQKYFVPYVNDWDLEILPHSLPTVKTYLERGKIKTLKLLQPPVRNSEIVQKRIKYGKTFYDFARDKLRELCLFIRPDMYALYEAHRLACFHIMNIRVIYTPKMKKCKNIASFVDILSEHTDNVIMELNYIRNVMLNNMKAFLDEHNSDSYMKYYRKNAFISRLKSVRLVRFFTFLLSEALRTCMEESIKQIVYVVETVMGKMADIEDDYEWGPNLNSTRFQGSIYHPFFKIKLFLDEKPHVFEDLGTYEEKIIDSFWTPLELMVQIGPLNPMPAIPELWPRDYMIRSYGLQEKAVVNGMKRIKKLLHKNIVALRAYLKAYEEDAEIWNLNAFEYAREFVLNNKDADLIVNEIKLHRLEANKVLTRIPSNIVIGMFEISTRWIADDLREKRFKTADYLAQFFTVSIIDATTYFRKRFTDIYLLMLKTPIEIDELLATEQKVHEEFKNCQKLMVELRQLQVKFELLHEIQVVLEENEVNEFGEVLTWPGRISTRYNYATHFSLPKMKYVLIECQKYFEDKFVDELDAIAVDLEKLIRETDIKQVKEANVAVADIQTKLDKCIETARLFKTRRELFGLRPRDFTQISQLTKLFEPYKTLWTNVLDWRTAKDAWLFNEVGKTNPDAQEAKFNEFYRLASRSIRDFKNNPELQDIANTIRDEMDNFRFFMEIFQHLHAPLKDRHWDVIQAEKGVDLHNVLGLTFMECLDRGVLKILSTLEEWSENANREYGIECGLNKITKEWDEVYIHILFNKRNFQFYTFKVSDDELQLIDDHKSLLLQLLYSPFRGIFEKDLLSWEKKLRIASSTIYKLLECQKILLYLEPIFWNPDIRLQLPAETGLFVGALSYWSFFTTEARMKEKFMPFAGTERLLRKADNCLDKFHSAMQGLNKYLEGKRQGFPRFYFLSDEELVDTLSQAKNPLAVQQHLRKCFENIYMLSFKKDLRIVAMASQEGETVKLSPSMYPGGVLEDWLNKLEAVMKQTVRVNAYHSLVAIAHTPRTEWILQWPGQVVIAASQTIWTARIERGFERNKLKPYFQRYLVMLNGLRTVIRGELTRVQRQVVSSLIVIEVHARDVFENLCIINASDVTDFAWICNLRYYWLNKDLKVKSLKAVFKYGYEYLGNSGRLVITPLTDRCYLTLTGALNLKFGGAPAGPAGTGKTETTKDLAKALAIQCVVFNCSDQLDYKAMGKFFKGLAGSGAWACFDEFNRIDIEVLSVVAQQITTIQKAQFAEVSMFMFEGAWIKMKTSCAVFITMNPGYAGRTELPDNLKALFRPVAMMVPNYTLIAEISLFSFGFSDSKTLAGKITTTFKLSSEQLSSQDHYDFGMRAVKTVISVAGNLKREHPKMDERQIILRALNDVNVPKFLTDDLKLFTGIVSDLFPRMQAEAINYGSFQKSIKKITFKDFKLQPVEGYVLKVIQLYETTVVRHGLMLVGPAGSGKTKCYEILQKTMTYCKGQKTPGGAVFSRVLTFVLNPKSITMAQLYGEVDINTLEWSDGILPFYARKGANAKNNYKRWYVFDGPVDAVWIENMNTVLDDNKKLCMTSGEVIKMTENMTMMFEVADLAVASPATVSRCGMVYIEPGVLGVNPLIEAWLRRLPRMAKSFSNRLRVLLKRYTLNGLKFMRKNLTEYVPSVDINILQSCFRLLNLFIRPVKLRDTGRKPSNSLLFQIKICLTGWVVFSTLWSVGATCDDRSRNKFSDYMKYKVQKHHAYPRNPKRSLYDYNFMDGGFSDVQKRSFKLPRWVSWTSNVGEYVIKSDMNYSDIEVPTIDNIRSANLVGRLLEGFHDVLCVGPTGTGKSVTIMSKLTRNMPKDFVVDFMTFSARTSSRQTQEVIEAKLDKLKKYIRGAPRGKIQILFIDDFNMPALETYGAQPPLELIRQLMDFGGWYSLLEVGQFLKIADVNLVAAMGPPGGGRNPVSARTLRHFHFISFPDVSYVSKKMIYGTILLSWLERTSIPDKYAFGLKALVLTIDTYSTIEQELLPTPAKTHYTFNLRDLSKVFQGILMTKPETYDSVDEFLILWFHEHCRVYGDRLINDIDNEWFEQMLVRKVEFYLSSDMAHSAGEHRRDSHSGKYHYTKRNVFFGDFLAPVDDKCYEKITNLERLEDVIEVYLYAYNMTSKNPMDLVLFEDALSHVCKVARIIRQPLGNGLLLGLAGSGRQSVTRLAAAAMEYSSFQIELTRSYSMNDWREDLKKMMMGAGIYKKETVFLFSDSQVKYEEFLEDLNNVLNSGDVPNIYEVEDKDLIMGAVRNEAMELGIAPTYPNLFSYYLKQIKARLHTVVTMSPIGELFRARLRQFPALVNCCTIDWFSDWPEDALRRVGTHFIERATWALKMPPFLVDRVVESCIFIHRNVVTNKEWYLKECARQVYITPSHFLGFLKTFVFLCEHKVETNYTEISRLTEGIKKLTQTEDEMAELQELILRSEPELIRQGERAVKMLEYIEESKAAALIKSQTIKESEKEIAEMMKVCAEIEREAQVKLELAMPDLRAAEAELQTLNKNDLSELKSLSKPPPGVKLTMEAVCVVLSVKPVLVVVEGGLGTKNIDYWIPAQRLLADPGRFLQTLFAFRIERAPPSVIQRLKKYINDPEFEPEKIEKASFACMSLCKWIFASVKYYYVHKDVAPKIKALKDAKKLARKMTAQLNQARRMMNNINRSILQLEEELENTHLKQQRIEQNIEYSKKRQKKAKQLVNKLGNEKDQWTEKKMKLQFITRFFFGDFLIGAGLIAYLGPFTSKYRNQMIEYWYCVLLGKNTPFIYREKEYIKGLCTSFQIENWIINGLPRDSFSVENGVMVQCSRRWPFFIDPQKQAYKWLKKMYKETIVIIKMDDSNFKDLLSGAIINGLVLLVETSTCELDTSLDPVLLKQTFFQRGQTLIKLADLILPYHENFRFYVTTTAPNPALTPEVYIKLTVINFTLSAVGLQEQLIGLTVQNEIPGLERYKVRLIESVAKLKEQIRSLQDLILQLIRETVSPVDDGRLKETLQISRIITRKSRIKISAANKAKKVLDEVRVKYSIIAIRGQLLFFCVSEMSTVDPMYQYSLDWFIDIFNKTLVTTGKHEEEVDETPLAVEGEEVGEEMEEEELVEEASHKSFTSVESDNDEVSFIDYKPSSAEASDVSASDYDFSKRRSSSEESVSFYEPEEVEKRKTKLKSKSKISKTIPRASRKSTYRSERLTKHTTLLWDAKTKQKGGRKSKKRSTVGSGKKSSARRSKIVRGKISANKQLTPDEIKQIRQNLILSTIKKGAKSKEGPLKKHFLKVDEVMAGRRKGLLELKAELKIIHLQRKLLISRQNKKMEMEEQFRKKIKRMFQQAVNTSADQFGQIKADRTTTLKLLGSSSGRNKLRENLKSRDAPRKTSEFKESEYSVRERCKTVSTELTFNVYANVCRSLFEKHKVILAFLLSIRLMKANRRVDSRDWTFFLAGDVPQEDLPLPKDATWMTERIWKDTLSLGNLKSFKPFVSHFIDNYQLYRNIVDARNPHKEPLPAPWTRFTIVKRLLVLKCLRYDRLIDAMYDFIDKCFGYKFIEPQVTDLSAMYGDSSPGVPLVFILSPGTDPADDLYKFARKYSMTSKFHAISLGQGQGIIAEGMFKEAVVNGHWVFFQNCHLAPSWMPRLESLIESVDPDLTNKNFRVWLTSLPSPSFPVGVLQKSSKITMEPPRGMKANLLRSYTGVVSEFKEIINNTESHKAQLFRDLLFALCLFHSVILERRKYGSLGFNNVYEFTDGDLRICISQLRLFLDLFDHVPYEVLRHTAGEINYGGRITDDWDRRCINHLLEDYYNVNSLKYIPFDPLRWYIKQPYGTNYEDYIKYIKKIPSVDYPQLVGLHDNASINYAFKETNLCFDVLLNLHPGVGAGDSDKDKEKILTEKVNSLRETIPNYYDELAIMDIKKRFPVMYKESLNTVLVQEVLRYNALLKIIHRSLFDLTRAISGTVVMSEALEKMYRSILSNRVPEMWTAKAYPSLKTLAPWVLDLKKRLAFIESWQLEQKLPEYWISGLYFPQAFLTACLQNHARKYYLPIDTLSFRFETMPVKKFKNSTLIYGLFMEGATWNSEKAVIWESQPKVLYTEMPRIALIPEQYHEKPPLSYTCPVYKTLLRAGTLSTTGHSTNFILAIELPSQHNEHFWIKRSVAMFTAVED